MRGRRLQRQGFAFERPEIEDLGRMVDVEADRAALLVEVEAHIGRDLAGGHARPPLEFHVERVGLWIVVVELHVGSSSKSRSGNRIRALMYPKTSADPRYTWRGQKSYAKVLRTKRGGPA